MPQQYWIPIASKKGPWFYGGPGQVETRQPIPMHNQSSRARYSIYYQPLDTHLTSRVSSRGRRPKAGYQQLYPFLRSHGRVYAEMEGGGQGISDKHTH